MILHGNRPGAGPTHSRLYQIRILIGTRTREALPPRSGPDPSPARIIEGHCCGGLPSIFSSEPPRGCTGRRLPVQGEPVPLHPAPATLGLVRGRLLNLPRYIRVAATGVHRGVRIGQAHKLPRVRGVTRAASADTLAGDRSCVHPSHASGFPETIAPGGLCRQTRPTPAHRSSAHTDPRSFVVDLPIPKPAPPAAAPPTGLPRPLTHVAQGCPSFVRPTVLPAHSFYLQHLALQVRS